MSFDTHTSKLRELAAECGELERIASPYFQAADWEKQGNHLAQVVGTNSVVDMHFAVDKLTKAGRDCANCGISAAVCQFAGVERMSQEEILALID